jgi:hypothetical protein
MTIKELAVESHWYQAKVVENFSRSKMVSKGNTLYVKRQSDGTYLVFSGSPERKPLIMSKEDVMIHLMMQGACYANKSALLDRNLKAALEKLGRPVEFVK